MVRHLAFIEAKGPSPTPEKQRPTINLLHKPLHLAQYCQKSTVLFATAKLRLVYQSQIKRTSASLGWTVL